MELTQAQPKKLFFKYLFTALGSTIITSIYSSVDLICVEHYCGSNGSAAISCLNPLWSLMISLGFLLGIGGSVCMSSRRGAGDTPEGNEYFSLSLLLSAAVSALLMVVYSLWRDKLMTFFGADGDVLPYAMDYTKWIVFALPAFLMGTALVSFIRNDGAPALCTAAILTGGAVNAAGDIYFVFDFGLGMGMSGAGLATALGQTIAFLIICSYFLRTRCRLQIVRVKRILRKSLNVLTAGFASFIVDISFGVTVILFNRQIITYAGNTELAVYGVVSTVAIFFQSLFYGVGTAIQPIISANYGARLYGRINQTRRYAMAAAMIISLLFFSLSELFPTGILKLYMDVTDEVLSVGPAIMRIYGVSFLFMGVNVVSAYYLQSMLQSWQSVAISLSRGLVLCAVFVMLLPSIFGFDSIWLTMPLTELLTMALSIGFLKFSNKALLPR